MEVDLKQPSCKQYMVNIFLKQITKLTSRQATVNIREICPFSNNKQLLETPYLVKQNNLIPYIAETFIFSENGRYEYNSFPNIED